ncbi:DUF4402 domain-containing protein [Phenylobacterium sp.]|uniref:DUF4402 domain-containing protein n=1 Tax=Phenylobacterium sp. TaxID=1871053 RepID=UPI002F425762
MAGRLSRVQGAILTLALCLAAPFAARAASLYTVTVASADLGVVTSAVAGDTDFRIDPTAGAVTIVSGQATRSANSSTRAMVTVACAAQVAGDCTHNVNVRLTAAGSPAGRARALTRLTFVMGTAQLAGSPGPPGQAAFTIAPVGPNASVTFFVGGDFAIAGDDSGLSTGVAEADFTAAVSETTPTGGGTGRFVATVIRSISVSKTSDLVFGSVQRPVSGAGSVTIDAVTGARTLTNANGLPTPVPARATFSIAGEGGQAFTVTVPSSFTMNGPQPLTVTTSSSSASPVLSGSLGSQGSFVFGVGATVPLSSTTPTGDYSGSFTVTVAYN